MSRAIVIVQQGLNVVHPILVVINCYQGEDFPLEGLIEHLYTSLGVWSVGIGM